MLKSAELIFTSEGPRSLLYEDRYFGQIGALRQAQEVFIKGCAISQRWRKQKHFTILETGFGLGFNFLATWHAWKQDPYRPERLHFLSVECHPLSLQQLAQAHTQEPLLADLARQLRLNLPPALAGLHRLEFEKGSVCLTLVYAPDVQALKMLTASVDAIFLDGFAPERNPDMWSQPLLNELLKRSKVGTQLSTWCAAGEMRRRLRQAGFEVASGPGIGAKRETTRASVCALPSRHPLNSLNVNQVSDEQRNVIVLGAGLAGTAVAERLIQRGWQVSLIDAAQGPAEAASGNPSGVVRPALSQDDNRSSQFTRAALLYAIQRWQRFLPRRHPAWHPTGVLQIARDKAQFEQWIALFHAQPMPNEWVQLLSQAQASHFSGYSVPYGGLLFPLAGWAEPALLCKMSLQSCSKDLTAYWNQNVQAVKREGGSNPQWIALDTLGNEIARAHHIVIASGAGPHIENPTQDPFLPSSLRRLQRVRGEITEFALHPSMTPLDLVLCGEGYVCPSPNGHWSVGATYDETSSLDITPQGIQDNTQKLNTLTGIGVNAHDVKGGRASFRSVAWDRLPIVGPDPEQEGLWHCRALASRGITWHGLAAELLVAQMEHEPLPLSSVLAEALSPSRKSVQLVHDQAIQ
jgi:tRNA 5-methylaminomethyl-2-thiouridine biosynthesis bifunctional protein